MSGGAFAQNTSDDRLQSRQIQLHSDKLLNLDLYERRAPLEIICFIKNHKCAFCSTRLPEILPDFKQARAFGLVNDEFWRRDVDRDRFSA